MENIIVSGFPVNLKLKTLVHSLKGILRKIHVDHFWVKVLEDVRGTNIKEAVIEISNQFATDAVDYLDGFVYLLSTQNHRRERYHLTAKVERERPPARERNYYGSRRDFDSRHNFEDRDDYRRERRRTRSRSPFFSDSRLDMKIELLRKERMLIEEERRLLMEREKLAILKELGPFASIELDSMYDRRHRSPLRRDASPSGIPKSWSPRRSEIPHRRTPPRTERSFIKERIPIQPNKNKVPKFVLPKKKLLVEMSGVISKMANPHEVVALNNLLGSTIRSRLAEALDNSTYKPTREIIILYRTLYPKTLDESLVENLLEKIRSGKNRNSTGNDNYREEKSGSPNETHNAINDDSYYCSADPTGTIDETHNNIDDDSYYCSADPTGECQAVASSDAGILSPQLPPPVRQRKRGRRAGHDRYLKNEEQYQHIMNENRVVADFEKSNSYTESTHDDEGDDDYVTGETSENWGHDDFIL